MDTGLLRKRNRWDEPGPNSRRTLNRMIEWPTPVQYDATPGGRWKPLPVVRWMAHNGMRPTPKRRDFRSASGNAGALRILRRLECCGGSGWWSLDPADLPDAADAEPNRARNRTGRGAESAGNGVQPGTGFSGPVESAVGCWLMGWVRGWTSLWPLSEDAYLAWLWVSRSALIGFALSGTWQVPMTAAVAWLLLTEG